MAATLFSAWCKPIQNWSNWVVMGLIISANIVDCPFWFFYTQLHNNKSKSTQAIVHIAMSLILISLLLITAVAYSAVGHGGASGYVAVLVLYGYAPEDLRPLVLSMNVLVTICLMLRYLTQKDELDIQWKLLFTLVALSIPAAFYGGGLDIDEGAFKLILGSLLLLSAVRLIVNLKSQRQSTPHFLVIAVVALVLGLLSGLTGIGGGVLLSPLLVIFGWSTAKQSLPIVSTFILFNSLAGLAGWLSAGNPLQTVPITESVTFYAIAVSGAILGGYWSTKYANNKAINRVLALVLVIAGVKMIGTA